ncbi:MAG TPA: SxtJ family membrane protein [Sedimentisphaerales bacterium]|nr:SxtJ family membrane protein [Sedimentisphaerales bacterium]
MSLMEIKWHVTHKELRNFGRISLIATSVIALLLHLLKGLAIQWASLIFLIGLVIFLSSLISLKVTRFIYLGLTLITAPIGVVVSFLLMASFYFLLITPLAFFFRLIGRDPLRRKRDADAKTYWLPHHPHNDPERYFRQF